jgi:LmbE family N-acetylglucosaminyl deacetylase
MLQPSDRILLFAPHPDDEALAAGGLLTRAFNEQIPVRIVFLTNGDNNPWAQRYCEKRWLIRSKDRQRWGERRKKEAIASVETLGGDSRCIRFMELPDQEITRLMMRGARQIVDHLRQEIQAWRPTLILQPSAEDTHPDHNAAHVFLSIARSTLPECCATVLNYTVHHRKGLTEDPAKILRLTPKEVQCKLQAILCHETQVAASRRRFTGYAKSEEVYFGNSPDILLQSPLRELTIRKNEVHLKVELESAKDLQLLLAMQTSAGHPIRHSLVLRKNATHGLLKDETTQSLIQPIPIHWEEGVASIQLSRLPLLRGAFVKVQRRKLFFDRSGWAQVWRTETDIRASDSSPLSEEPRFHEASTRLSHKPRSEEMEQHPVAGHVST